MVRRRSYTAAAITRQSGLAAACAARLASNWWLGTRILVQVRADISLELARRLLPTIDTRGTHVAAKRRQGTLDDASCRFRCAVVVVLAGRSHSASQHPSALVLSHRDDQIVACASIQVGLLVEAQVVAVPVDDVITASQSDASSANVRRRALASQVTQDLLRDRGLLLMRHADILHLGADRAPVRYSQPMGVKDIKIGTLADAARWTRRALLAAMRTPSGSPERQAKLDDLIQATTRARFLAEAYDGKLAVELRVTLRVAEIVLARVKSGAPAGSPRHQTSGT